MPKPAGLFYIREIAAVCGISINTLRFYESKGILTPAHTDAWSGYRYYSRQNLYRLRAVLGLKDAGLSLPEIKEYLDGGMHVDMKIEKLMERRELLNRVIEDLNVRRTPPGELKVYEISLPERLCLTRTIHARDGEHALSAIDGFYDELIRRGVKISRAWPEFCEYPDEGLLEGEFKVEDFTVTACVPIDKKNAPPEAAVYPAGEAAAVNYRGGYYGLWKAYEALRIYIESHGYVPSGSPQEIYPEINTNGSVQLDDSNQITRVIVPVKKER